MRKVGTYRAGTPHARGVVPTRLSRLMIARAFTSVLSTRFFPAAPHQLPIVLRHRGYDVAQLTPYAQRLFYL